MDEASPAELDRYLAGVRYPATREELLATAAANRAPDDLVARLANIEEDEYESPDAVSAAFSFEGGTTMRYGHVTIYDQ